MSKFKASKKRQIKEPEPVAQGRQLIASTPIKEQYYGSLRDMIDAMAADYEVELTKALSSTSAADAKIDSKVEAAVNKRREKVVKIFDKLKVIWTEKILKQALKISALFVDDVDSHSKLTMKLSLSTLGIEKPELTYAKNIVNTLKIQQDYNNTLITGLQAEYHEKAYAAVMNSLASPDPEKQGQAAIIRELNEIGIKEKKRAKLIARDQTTKVYSALNEDRMAQNGVTHFKWIHSSAAKEPRHTHVAKNNQIFELNDPRLWEGPKSDQGPPGYAINCGCRAVPVLLPPP